MSEALDRTAVGSPPSGTADATLEGSGGRRESGTSNPACIPRGSPPLLSLRLPRRREKLGLQVLSGVGHSGGSAGYRYVKSFFIPLVCLGMLLSGLLHLFLPGETEKHMSCPRNVRRWRDTARTGPSRYPLGLSCSCRPVRDLRASPSIRAGTFHSSTTALVSSQSARSPVDDGCSRSVDCLQARA